MTEMGVIGTVKSAIRCGSKDLDQDVGSRMISVTSGKLRGLSRSHSPCTVQDSQACTQNPCPTFDFQRNTVLAGGVSFSRS